jgi:hypothetical protein
VARLDVPECLPLGGFVDCPEQRSDVFVVDAAKRPGFGRLGIT